MSRKTAAPVVEAEEPESAGDAGDADAPIEASWRDPDIETLRLSRKITSRLRANKIESIGALVDALDNGETFELEARDIAAIWHAIKTNSDCPGTLIDGEEDDSAEVRTCRVCGCSEDDCSECVAAMGRPCSWVDGEKDLCTRCAPVEAIASTGEPAASSPATASGPAVYNPAVPLDKIAPSPTNPRKTFDAVKLGELAKSIAEKGVLEPILLRPYPPDPNVTGEGFEIVAGERRYRATKLAGLTTIPATIRDYSDRDVVEIQIIENDQREDVHELEQAEGYATLIRLGIADAETLAIKIGRTPKYVYARLALNGLIDAWKADFAEGKITFAVATLLARLPVSRQEQVRPQGKYTQSPIYSYNGDCMSIAVVKRNLQDKLINLSAARWKLDDAELLPSAGACRACPKRTGSKPDLFADLIDDAGEEGEYEPDENDDDENFERKPKAKAKGKPKAAPDYCTDGVCFEAKESAMVQLNVRKLAAKTKVEPTAIPVVSERWHSGDKSDLLSASKYDELLPKDVKAFGKAIPADVRQAVLGDGREAGKTIYIRMRPEQKASGGGGDTDRKKKQKQEEDRRRLQKLADNRAVGLAMDKLATGGAKSFAAVWPHLAPLFEDMLWADNRRQFGQILGFDHLKDPKAFGKALFDKGKTDAYAALGVACGVVLLKSLFLHNSQKNGHALLRAVGIDYKAVAKELQAEQQAAKQKPAAKKKPAKARAAK